MQVQQTYSSVYYTRHLNTVLCINRNPESCPFLVPKWLSLGIRANPLSPVRASGGHCSDQIKQAPNDLQSFSLQKFIMSPPHLECGFSYYSPFQILCRQNCISQDCVVWLILGKVLNEKIICSAKMTQQPAWGNYWHHWKCCSSIGNRHSMAVLPQLLHTRLSKKAGPSSLVFPPCDSMYRWIHV